MNLEWLKVPSTHDVAESNRRKIAGKDLLSSRRLVSSADPFHFDDFLEMRAVSLVPPFPDSPYQQKNSNLIPLAEISSWAFQQLFSSPSVKRIIELSPVFEMKLVLVFLAESNFLQVFGDFDDDILRDELDRIHIADLAVEFVRCIPNIVSVVDKEQCCTMKGCTILLSL